MISTKCRTIIYTQTHAQPQGSPIENAVCCRRHRLLQGAGGAGAGTWRPRGSRQASIHSGSLRRANLGTVYAVTDMDAPGRALWTATAWFGDSFRAVLEWRPLAHCLQPVAGRIGAGLSLTVIRGLLAEAQVAATRHTANRAASFSFMAAAGVFGV